LVIKVKHEPSREVVIKEVVEYPSVGSFTRLLNAYFRAGQLIMPNWTEGVLSVSYTHLTLPTNLRV